MKIFKSNPILHKLCLITFVTILGIGSANACIVKAPLKGTNYDYDESKPYSCVFDGLAAVSKNGKWGFINSQYQEVVPLKYGEVQNFNDGLARVKFGNKFGFVNKAGKVIIPIQYDDATEYADKGIIGIQQNGKWGFINYQNNIVIKPQYDEILGFDYNFGVQGSELLGVKNSAGWGFIDHNGRVVLSFKDVQIGQFVDGRAKVNYGWLGTYYMSKKGNLYKYIGDEHNGLLGVESNDGKVGYIDREGNMVIPAIYDDGGNFDNTGKAEVTLNGQTFYIDKKGNRTQ